MRTADRGGRRRVDKRPGLYVESAARERVSACVTGGPFVIAPVYALQNVRSGFSLSENDHWERGKQREEDRREDGGTRQTQERREAYRVSPLLFATDGNFAGAEIEISPAESRQRIRPVATRFLPSPPCAGFRFACAIRPIHFYHAAVYCDAGMVLFRFLSTFRAEKATISRNSFIAKNIWLKLVGDVC